MSVWQRRAMVVGLLTAVLVPLGYGMFRHLAIRGLQAEALIMLSYLQTLENAYYLENHSYVYFEEYYGAPMGGEDHCKRPAGAETLGMEVRWCHEDHASPVRYAYRVRKPEGVEAKGFVGEAISGSDALKQSFVCFGDEETDRWTISERGNAQRRQSCD